MSGSRLDRFTAALTPVAARVDAHASIGSTNSRALELADAGAPHGTVVWADQQTGGRGRQGRSWYSPAGAHLYLSVVLRPKVLAVRAAQLTLEAACAVAEAIDSVEASPMVRLKWPNDLVVPQLDADGAEAGFRKLSGILTELRTRAVDVDAVVVGIGVNVASMAGSPVDRIATSLCELHDGWATLEPAALDARRARLAAEIVRRLTGRVGGFAVRGRFDRDAWLSRALSFGRKVQVSLPGMPAYTATTLDLDDAGRLRVDRSGVVETIVGGEVTFG